MEDTEYEREDEEEEEEEENNQHSAIDGLRSVRNVAFHHLSMHEGENVVKVLIGAYAVMPSIERVHWVVPQRSWEGRSTAETAREPECCRARAGALMDIPTLYDGLYYANNIIGEHVVVAGWRYIRMQLAQVMRVLGRLGAIPKTPEPRGVFLVRPKCEGVKEEGKPCSFLQTREDGSGMGGDKREVFERKLPSRADYAKSLMYP